MAEPDALPPPRHEARDVGAHVAWLGAPLLIVIVLACVLFVWWLYPHSLTQQPLQSPPQPYPEPALQVNPAADLARVRAAAMARLNSAGWIDQAQGIAHVPIDQAMRDVARDGISDWPMP